MGFLFGLVMLVGQHAGFLAAGAAAFLAADAFRFLLPGQDNASNLRLHPVAKFPAGEVAIQRLQALALAFDLNARGLVEDVDARRGFVDLLPARAGAPDESFNEIALADAEFSHPPLQLGFLVRFDSELEHLET